MQLVQSPHASSLYPTRVLLARTTCAANDAASAIFERLGPLLDPASPGRQDLCRRCCSLCSFRTPRAFTRPEFSRQAQTAPPMLQLVQSPNTSGLYLTYILLADINCAADGANYAISERFRLLLDPGSTGRHQLCRRCCSFAVSERLGPFRNPGSPGGTNCATDAAACAVSKRLGP